ncbi:MAG: hypothetical protein AAB177_17920 [Nitrospirota bacterium]
MWIGTSQYSGGGVGADLHIHITEPTGPIGEQMTSEMLVPKTEPF